jgi:hypothetical protein
VHVWLAVVLSGAAGGALGAFLPGGADVPWPPGLDRLFQGDGIGSLAGNLLRNTMLGAVASFLVWALATPTSDFQGSDVTVGVVAAAIIAGGGGTSILNNLFRQSRKISSDRQAIDLAGTLLSGENEDENATS